MIFVNYLTIVSVLITLLLDPLGIFAAVPVKNTEVAPIKSLNTQDTQDTQDTQGVQNRTILIIWDGLRPDLITKENTPVLYQLKKTGSYFNDHHSSFPSLTMNNANSFSTGSYSGSTGFYGNKVWRADITDANQPLNIEKYDVLKKMSDQSQGKPLMYLESLLEIANKNGLKTAQVGKEAPVLIQSSNKELSNNIILTESKIYPENFLKQLQDKKYILPEKFVKPGLKSNSNKDSYPFKKENPIELKAISSNIPLANLSDPSKASKANKALRATASEYWMAVYIREILAVHKPDLSVLWFAEPDSTAHTYGPASQPYYQALKNQDQLLGSLLLTLGKLNLLKTTNIIVASDHSMSTVSGDLKVFPLRESNNGIIGAVNNNGFSTSGSIRVADILTKSGFTAYDGNGCSYNPGIKGIFADKSLLEKINIDKTGDICQTGPGTLYITRSYKLPEKLGEQDVIVANNGSSVYIYVPSKDEVLVKKLVRLFQSRVEFDSIFVNPEYGDLAGTLSLKKIFYYDEVQQRHPDIVVSLSYDENQVVNGLKGTTYTTSENSRGSHGGLSSTDIHNVLVANGPDFKKSYLDNLPSANIDVAVTIAKLLNLPLENRTGRVLFEAIMNANVNLQDYEVEYKQVQPSRSAIGLAFIRPDSTAQQREYYTNKDKYTFVLNTKELSYKDQRYTYIDSGKSMRY